MSTDDRSWMQPLAGKLKINMDITTKPGHGHFGTGVIYRDDDHGEM